MAKPKIDKAPIVSYLWKRNVHKKYVMIPNAAPKPVNNVMKTSFCCFINRVKKLQKGEKEYGKKRY